jgi:hypothetical protein
METTAANVSPLLDIIVMSNLPHSDGYHQQCVSSVLAAIGKASFPCRLVATKGNLKAIAKARGAAFDLTSAPYVTWVVDFDYLQSDAIEALAPHFEKRPPAIFTREMQRLGKGRYRKIGTRHHLAVYRRDIVETVRPLFDVTGVDEVTKALHAVADRSGEAVDLMHFGYVRRMEREVQDIYRREIRNVTR